MIYLFRKMAAKQPATVQEVQTRVSSEDSPLESLEDKLFSMEKMDRASPELWPEQIPGVSEFVPLRRGEESPPIWSKGLNSEDMLMVQQLSSMPVTTLIMEVKKLHDLAYQLGVEEAKQMTRGMYLNIFKPSKSKIVNLRL